MKKLEKLTKEQEALIPIVREEWINKLQGPINKKDCIEGIEWMYSISDLKKPKIIFVNSPLAAQKTVNELEGNKENKYYPFGWRGTIFDYGWLSFYDYFSRIGIVKHEGLTKLIKLINAKPFMMIQLEKLCVVSKMPEHLHRDEQGRMHSLDGPSISWSDGYALFQIHGVMFDKELFKSVSQNKLPAKEILKLENMEQRMIALKIKGAESLLTELDARLLDKSERGNELYVLTDVFEDPAYYLKYTCPSTDRVYVSGIDPQVGIDGNADACMAWKHKMPTEMYDDLRIES